MAAPIQFLKFCDLSVTWVLWNSAPSCVSETQGPEEETRLVPNRPSAPHQILPSPFPPVFLPSSHYRCSVTHTLKWWKLYNHVNAGNFRLLPITEQFTKKKNNQSDRQSLLDQSLSWEESFGGNENTYRNKSFKAAICILFVLLLQELNHPCILTLQGLLHEQFPLFMGYV